MKNKLNFGILVADIDEYIGFEKRVLEMGANELDSAFRKEHRLDNDSYSIHAVCSGIGKVNAASASTYLAINGCDVILNFGYSGGISNVSKGDIVVCDSFLEHDFDLTPIGYAPCQKPGEEYIYEIHNKIKLLCQDIFSGVLFGRAVCGDCFICDDKKRDKMKNEFGAVSCDMETAAIASVCNRFKLPFLSVREISDDAGNDADSSYKDTVKSQKIGMLDMIFDFIDTYRNSR